MRGIDRQGLERAAAQQEVVALWWLGICALKGEFEDVDMARAERFFREAAELGHASAQNRLSKSFLSHLSLEYYQWLRRAALQSNDAAVSLLKHGVSQRLKLYDKGELGSGRILYEIGAALCFGRKSTKSSPPACERVLKLYDQWNNEAKNAVLYWLWLAKDVGVAKDIRLLIADLIWEDRAAWSEKGTEAVASD
jgi:TPR repeat protein